MSGAPRESEAAPPLRAEIRDAVREADVPRVHELVASSGFFSAEERQIAVELVRERLDRGEEASGYRFLFLDVGGVPVAYACFGRIPMTESSFDLYWIVTDARERGRGHGRRLVREVEERIAREGGGRLYVETSSRAQYEPTRAFYDGLGYERAVTFEDFYAPGDGKVVFLKRIEERRRTT